MPSPNEPASKKDPLLTLTQRFNALDVKFDAKHAEVEAQAEETTRVVDGFKKCASRTRMSFQAPTEEELEDEVSAENGNGVLPPTTFLDPEKLAEVLDRDRPVPD